MCTRNVEIAILENHDTFLVFLQTGNTIKVLPQIGGHSVPAPKRLWQSPLGILLAVSLVAYKRIGEPATRKPGKSGSDSEQSSLGSDSDTNSDRTSQGPPDSTQPSNSGQQGGAGPNPQQPGHGYNASFDRVVSD